MEELLDFIIANPDTGDLSVHVVIHYPFYDVSINGDFAAQLEQDHHSNWFITTGHLEDNLVQQIGRRIVEYITQ